MLLQENMLVADRFRLTRLIGKGGMGSVWGAVQLGLERPCAVKFIEGELANVAEAHARFEREARAAAQLQSPHVVQIFDHGVWQGHPYIAMELLNGEDLGKRLARSGGRLPPATVGTIVQQVCRALAKAHQAGIVHRDLKPDNIFLVSDDDNPEVVKILDFGVAKQTSQAIDGSNTKTGAMLGTPYYMSPEQAQGIKSVDARSDLWSLAVIVFQCLTGRLPFESEALGDLLVKIIVSPIPSPSSYAADLPPGFERWWQKASDRNVDGRYQTAKEFASELSMALGQTNPTGELPDRQAALRMGGGTAVMANSPPTEVMGNKVNTPNPNHAPSQTTGTPAHTAAMMTTPHPGFQQNAQQTPSNPYGQQQQPMQQGMPHGASTGNPVVAATFSGVDSPAGVPKKSPPIAVFVGIGLLAVIGLGLGGFAMVKRSQNAAAAGAGSASATATETATADTASATATASATPPASATATATATAEASATASAASAASAATTATAGGAGTGTGTGAATNGGAVAAKAPAKPVGGTAPAKPPTTPPANPPAKPPGGPKPINLGF